VFPKIRDTPKWMVKIMENPINPWMILGGKPTIFGNTLIFSILLADLGGMTEERMKKALGEKDGAEKSTLIHVKKVAKLQKKQLKLPRARNYYNPQKLESYPKTPAFEPINDFMRSFISLKG